MTTDIRFRDFSSSAKPVHFKIDADTFEAPAVLPVPVMQELVSVAEKLKNIGEDPRALDAIHEVFDTILTEASAKRLRERISSKEEPVGITQLIDIMLWLLEVYGLRPTEPSADSSTGSPIEASGTPSAAGAPPAG